MLKRNDKAPCEATSTSRLIYMQDSVARGQRRDIPRKVAISPRLEVRKHEVVVKRSKIARKLFLATNYSRQASSRVSRRAFRVISMRKILGRE